MSNRLNKERELKLQPLRLNRAIKAIESKLGYKISNNTDTTIYFLFKNQSVRYYPYSGWATGKPIKDGRGLKKLLNQLK